MRWLRITTRLQSCNIYNNYVILIIVSLNEKMNFLNFNQMCTLINVFKKITFIYDINYNSNGTNVTITIKPLTIIISVAPICHIFHKLSTCTCIIIYCWTVHVHVQCTCISIKNEYHVYN